MCTVYLGTSKTDNHPIKQELKLEEIYEKLTNPRISEKKDGSYILTVLLGDSGRRIEKNVEKIGGFFLDFDKGVDEFTIRKRLKEFEFMAHTTYSHTAENPRWRVFIPYSKAYPASLHKSVYEYMVKLFSGYEIDKRCKTASQLWYLPTCSNPDIFRSFRNDGKFFDPTMHYAADAALEHETVEIEEKVSTFRVPAGQRDQWFFDEAIEYRQDGRIEAETLAGLEAIRSDPYLTEQPRGNEFTYKDLKQKVASAYRDEYDIGKDALEKRVKNLDDAEQMDEEFVLPTIKEREERWFLAPPAPPEVLLPGLLQNDVMLFNAAGGGTKTTLALWIEIRIILGLPIFERKANRTGSCLYVTAEDKTERLDYRIHKLCSGMELNRKQQKDVSRGLYVENWRGLNRRFMESDNGGNLTNTGWCDFLIDKYMNTDLAMMVIDPIVLFSPGERFANDGWASLMTRIGWMAEELGNINALCCHHTGQDSYRSKQRDQYSGRGATANADQSRGVLTANYYSEDEDHKLVPIGITKYERENGLVIRLDAGKLSDEPRSLAPLWAVRGDGDNWLFRTYRSEDPAVAEIARKEKIKKKQEFNVDKVVHFLQGNSAVDYFNKKDLEIQKDILELSRQEVRDAIELGISNGRIVNEPLPFDEKQGLRKTYLKVSTKSSKKHTKPKRSA